jgi:SpoIIAA-like
MLKLIEGLPQDVFGIEAAGKVTHEDYQKTLIPAAEAMMTKGPVRMLYVAGPDFSGYELEALWDDATFGFKYWHQFTRIAVVTESTWLRAAITMFSPFFSSEIRLFKFPELGAAKDWIADKKEAAA